MWQAILNSFKSFLGKFLKSASKKQLEIIMPIAQNAVNMIKTDPSVIINGSKRETAFDMIVKELTTKEGDFANHLINLAIELAVCELKELVK